SASSASLKPSVGIGVARGSGVLGLFRSEGERRYGNRGTKSMQESKRQQRFSSWDFTYAVDMGIACLISYWVITFGLARFVDTPNDLLGGMWAVVATVFVFRDTRSNALSAGLSRLIATLGDAQELLLHVRTSGRDAVVPFWMEGIALYVECRDLLVGDLDALGIGVGIEFAADFETGFRRGVCDQFDGHEEADERHGPPVLGNVAEHAVLDLVPLRGPRRIMADLDDQAGLVGELLQRHLPQS